MAEPELAPIDEADDQPVTHGEFSSVMRAIKHDLDQTATKADLAKLQETTEMLRRSSERMLELIEGLDRQLKELRHLPEDVRRLKEAVFR